MVAQLIRTRRPDRLVCALDFDWRPAWRVKLIPSYKAHRLAPGGGPCAEVVPDNLEAQVPLILEVLGAVGITAIGAKGYEADDVIGTLAATQPGPVEVASGDRDLFQLIDDASRSACSTAAAASASSKTATTRRCARSTACRRPATPISRRCAATRATACPAWPAWATRRRRA